MEVSLNRKNYNYIEFVLSPDSMDGVPLVKKVYISGENIGRLNDARAALIAYLLTNHLIGNSLSFCGLACPPYLAGLMNRDFSGREFFISPINNSPKKILPRQEVSLSTLGRNTEDGAAQVKVDDLGAAFQAMTESGDQLEGEVRTNAKLSLVGQSSPLDLTYSVILCLLLSDVVGTRKFLLPIKDSMSSRAANRFIRLSKEVGVDVKAIF